MPLLDLFNDLIVEHGSAVVQGKHIAMFRDQLTILDKKLLESESRIKQLESENKYLKTEKDELIKKIEIYNETPKPFFHANLLWLPNDPNPYCPACYGTDNKLVYMATVQIQDIINDNIIHKSVFTCSTSPKCKNMVEISSNPKLKST